MSREEWPDVVYDQNEWPDEIDGSELFRKEPQPKPYRIVGKSETWMEVSVRVPLNGKIEVGELININDVPYRVVAVLSEDFYLGESKKRVKLRIELFDEVREDGHWVLDNQDANMPRCWLCDEPLSALIIEPTKWDEWKNVVEVKWSASHHGEVIAIEGLDPVLWPGRDQLPENFSHLYVDFERSLIVCIPNPE